MARGRMDANHRPNTLKENKIVLSELRSRGKFEQRTPHELNKLFAKLNWDGSPKHWKNGKTAPGKKHEKTPVEHPYGPVDGFPPGSWWGIRMDCSRDRIHGPFNADIQDGPAGAVSLCTSQLNGHNDEDLGDCLTFTGDEYEPGVQSDHPLLRSYQSQVPLRLIRSYNLTNDFAPKTGYRYDGLYTVAAWWIGVSLDGEKRYKFALVRLRNQEPPVWQESIGTSGKNAVAVTSASAAAVATAVSPQTRCNAERFSTDLCGETHSSVNDQDIAAGSSRGRSEAVKFSFNKSHAADKLTPESKRKAQDSAIVTRCISVKKAECPSSTGMGCVPYSESPVMNAHRVLEGTAKLTPCKLQNTNISIRTDLYDSSHNIQQETKKSIPMTFCRTFVSARNTRVANSHSHVGTLNLNTCGPCPRDGEQESLIQSRSGIVGKVLATQSPCSDSIRSADRSTPNISSVVSPIEEKMHLDAIDARISQISGTVDAPDCAIGDRTTGKRSEHREQRDKENSPAKTSDEIDDDYAIGDDPNPICPITRTSSRKTVETPPETDRDEPRDEMPKEQRTALDSFTPEQMLKYIVKQKYHPTAKLLIGSVIGLATGESKILRTYDSLISRNKSWSRDKKLHGEQGDSPSSGKDEQTLNRAQGTSDKPMKNERSVKKSAATQKRGTKERILTMRLRRTRVSKRLLGSEKMSGGKNPDNSSERLRKSKESEKTQQPFSKSTSPKNSKKSAKKRRSELANLAIDANIGPKIRGPRNRRLRGRSHIFTRKRHDMDLASCCGGSRAADVGVRGKKVTSRVELSSKRSKRVISSTKPPRKPPQSRYMEHKKRVQKTETSNVERKIQSSAITLSGGNTMDSSRKREKRKVSPPPPTTRSREQVSGNSSSSDDSSKRLCRRTEKDASTIDRIITMVDAATQCSSRRDASTCIENTDVERPNEGPENSVKVEWIDLDDVKSESRASDGEEEFVLELASENYPSSENETTIRDEPEIQEKSAGILPMRPSPVEKSQIANVAQRLSAFVPVNISDSDFRIARLRSIGFRPIDPVCMQHEKDDKCTASCASGSTVVNRVADEQYNKYTSEETTVVGYMDQDLRFEDIEEDVVSVIRDIKNPRAGVNAGNKVTRVRSKKPESARVAKAGTQKARLVVAPSLEDDSEVPWHGWKKFVKNKQEHWIGW